jgi:hypothetical protein
VGIQRWAPNRRKPSAEVSEALEALTVRLDGRPAAVTNVYCERSVTYNPLGLAVERRLLVTNPNNQVQWTAPGARPAEVVALRAGECELPVSD